MLSEFELGWLVGLLEGEGCFTIKKHSAARFSPKIQVRMTDRDTVERVARAFGNGRTVHVEPQAAGRQACYRIQVSGEPAAALMRAIAPHLSLRRKRRVWEILDWWSLGAATSSAPLSASRL